MTQQGIVPPVVVAEGLDVTFHRSPDDVVSHYEPWFTTAKYRAFDAEGRRLELVAEPPIATGRLLGPVRTDNAHRSSLSVRAVESEPTGARDLADLLRTWLPMVDVALDDPDQMTLRELLLQAIARVGFT